MFLCVSKARTIRSVLSSPLGPTLSISKRLDIFTASSALPLDDGRLTDDPRWRIPHLRKKSSVSLAANSGPHHWTPQWGPQMLQIIFSGRCTVPVHLLHSFLPLSVDVLSILTACQQLQSSTIPCNGSNHRIWLQIGCRYPRVDWWNPSLRWRYPVATITLLPCCLNILCNARPKDCSLGSFMYRISFVMPGQKTAALALSCIEYPL